MKSRSELSSSNTSDSRSSDGNEWLDVEPDEEEPVAILSLLDSKTFPSASEMLTYCKNEYGFDFKAVAGRLKLDFHGAVKLINFIRKRRQEEHPLPEKISNLDLEDDEYLKPVIENDALIFSLEEVLDLGEDELKDATISTESGKSTQDLRSRTKELEEELEAITRQFSNYRLAVEQTLERRWGDDKETSQPTEAGKKNNSDYYFESYAGNDIHETMLKDTIRTDAYRDFIYDNKDLFKGKTVLDIGCGTGILSMFCAKAGAEIVIAVDKSEIIDKARENIFNNGLSNVITCLRGAIEDVTLPVKQVDIIVSEWMGYCLLYEAMLPSVLYARDRYLKPGGLMVPSSASLWIAPVVDQAYVSDHVSFWRDVYGFDMKAMQEGIFEDVRVDAMPENTLCGVAHPFRTLDLRFTKPEDLLFTADWESQISREVDELDGFLIWFDIFFATNAHDAPPAPSMKPKDWVREIRGNAAFTTGPAGTETHWKQGLLMLSSSQATKNLSKGCIISGQVSFEALEENSRALMIRASWQAGDGESRTQDWKLK